MSSAHSGTPRLGVPARRRLVAALSAAVLTAGVLFAAPVTPAAASTSRPASGFAQSATQPSSARGGAAAPTPPAVLKQQRTAGNVRATYYVELAGSSVADTFKQNRSRGTSSAKASAGGTATAIASHVATVSDAAKRTDPDATVLYSTKNVMPGFAVSTTAAAAAEMAARPDVVSVSTITPAKVATASTDEFTQALATWQSTGYIGTGVKIGIIDTGIDYTHSDFGGDSDSYATATAQASSQTYNWRSKLTTKGQAKIAGGYDFAGTVLRRRHATPPLSRTPTRWIANQRTLATAPTSRASSAGTARTRMAPPSPASYQTLTGAALNSMEIAPGSAPGAQIYSLKVFGCSGSSDLVLEALDWALDPNSDGDDSDHLDIVNLSLGSDYSAEDDPENTMIDKLASYGVLSVVAAGNAGDITLVGGSPGSAVSALTVADSVGDTPPDAADTLNSSSSRGTYGSIGTIKPDVAAPGTDIVSAGFGTGNAGVSMTGTSMATPHVAGIAALVKQAHPSWTAGEIKADVMNTAVHDLTTEAGGAGIAYGPNRVGSGRVDASLATTNTLGLRR